MAFWDQDALLNRKVWGTDVYTDDSDIMAMCLHAGWIQGPILQDVPSWVPPGKAMLAWREMTKMYVDQGLERIEDNQNDKNTSEQQVVKAKQRLERLSLTADLSVVVRIAPKLIAYKGSQRCGVKSRSWGNGHDGVSLVIESVCLKESGYASGEKGLRNTKHRIDHLARLKTLATIAIDEYPVDHKDSDDNSNKISNDDGDRAVQGGGLINILIASKVANKGRDETMKPFWQVDVNNGRLVH
jgi:hypothetical protein